VIYLSFLKRESFSDLYIRHLIGPALIIDHFRKTIKHFRGKPGEPLYTSRTQPLMIMIRMMTPSWWLGAINFRFIQIKTRWREFCLTRDVY
jgi:hypothetical protein